MLLLSSILCASAWAGWSFAPMPIGDFSTDHGIGYGGFVQATRRLPDEELYRLRLGLQVFWSTGDFRDHWLKADWRITELWRVEGVGGYRAWDWAPYYGRGSSPIEPDVEREFYSYSIAGARVLLNVRRQLAGPFELFTTGFLRSAAIDPWADSLLAADGADSGRYSALAVGVLYDSRDRLPSPSRGHLAEISIRGAHPVVGSQYTGGGVNLTERAFVPLAEAMVLATRLSLDLRWGDTPMFVDHVVGGSQWLTLGGPWGLRGYPEGRFRADGVVMLSPELRWTVWTFGIRDHQLALMPTPFLDAAWMPLYDDPAQPIRGNVGLGARFVWDEDFVLRIDTAVGSETTTIGTREPSLGIWFMFDHPF